MTDTNAALAWRFGPYPQEITRRSKANFASTDLYLKAHENEAAHMVVEHPAQEYLVPRSVHDDVVNCFGRWIVAGRDANRHLLTNVLLSDEHATLAHKDIYRPFHGAELTVNRSYQEAIQTLLGYTGPQKEKHLAITPPQFSILLQYKSVLDELLGAHTYQGSDPYTDTLGGLVIDYFHERNRITVVLSSDRAHVLTFVGGEVREGLFKAPATAIVSISTFLEEILAQH
jgi:hypothetical protein